MMNKVLAAYLPLVDYLGEVLTSDYEIALHDCSNEGAFSIIAIRNGHISGRSVGSPLTGKALAFINDKEYEKNDYVLNYTGTTSNNTKTISSTMFIKDAEGQLLGMLCINHSVTQDVNQINSLLKVLNLSQRFSLQEKTDDAKNEQAEVFANDVSDVIASIINANLPLGTSTDRLTQEERVDLIRLLKDKSVFSIKGAVQEVAKQLQCSEPTIYRYLKNL